MAAKEEVLEHAGVVLRKFAPRQEHSRHARYEGGSDSETTHELTWVVQPKVRDPLPPRADLRVRSVYVASDRFDSHYVSVWLASAGGERVDLYSMSDNEKYGHRRDREDYQNLDRLADALMAQGYPRLGAEDLQALVSLVASHYH